MNDKTLTKPGIGDTIDAPHLMATASGAPSVETFARAAPLVIPGYELLEVIGRGGMGVVWQARDLALKRNVAVKILLENFASNSSIAARFVEEAQITSQLQHPGIPAIYAVGEIDDRPWLAMKLIKGRTLHDLLAAGGSLNVLAIFEAISQAVGYAHAHGIIHRDLKPQNIMVGAFGEVQVMDWGLAKLLASGGRKPPGSDSSEPALTAIHTPRDADTPYTQAGSILGTPAYMPPEQAAGLIDQVSERSDVFGLGAILCQMLTGLPPFAGKDAESVRRNAVRGQMDEAMALLAASGADPDVASLCKKCLSFEPNDRPVNAGELAKQVAELRAAADERARQAELQRARAEVQAAEQRKRRRLQLVYGGIAIAILLVGATIAFWQQKLIADKDALRAAEREEEAQRTIETNARLLAGADDKQFVAAFPHLAAQGERGLPKLRAIADAEMPTDATDEEKEKLTKQRTTALIALMRFGEAERIWPLLKHTPDPTIRSYLVNRFAALGVDPKLIIQRLEVEPDLSSRRALILSLGEFDEAALPMEQRQALIPKLQAIYRDETDAGLHAATEWLLRTWKQDDWLKQVNDEWAKNPKASGGRQPSGSASSQNQNRGADTPRSPGQSPTWSVNSQGQTMIAFRGPVEFLMGSPESEPTRRNNETRHLRHIPRSFAISATHITFEQFLKYDSTLPRSISNKTDNCPATLVSWHQAASYCNWLSEQEGIKEEHWCYEINAGTVTRMKANYLSLSGYRLPTEAEWEYAVRSESEVAYSFGEYENLLRYYGWFVHNSKNTLHPVAQQKPNDFGLFDGHGNALCWCQNTYGEYPALQAGKPITDAEGALVLKSTVMHALRGGSFLNTSSYCRSSIRYEYEPAARFDLPSLRLARTLAP